MLIALTSYSMPYIIIAKSMFGIKKNKKKRMGKATRFVVRRKKNRKVR